MKLTGFFVGGVELIKRKYVHPNATASTHNTTTSATVITISAATTVTKAKATTFNCATTITDINAKDIKL